MRILAILSLLISTHAFAQEAPDSGAFARITVTINIPPRHTREILRSQGQDFQPQDIDRICNDDTIVCDEQIDDNGNHTLSIIPI